MLNSCRPSASGLDGWASGLAGWPAGLTGWSSGLADWAPGLAGWSRDWTDKQTNPRTDVRTENTPFYRPGWLVLRAKLGTYGRRTWGISSHSTGAGAQTYRTVPYRTVLKLFITGFVKGPTGSVYKLFGTGAQTNETVDWETSRRRCNESGGHLAILDTDEENQFVTESFGVQIRETGSGATGGVYLGASDLENEGDWMWVDGSPVDMSLFANGQPSNLHDVQHCAAIRHGFEDVDCTYKRVRVCEYKNVVKCTIDDGINDIVAGPGPGPGSWPEPEPESVPHH